MTLNSYFGQFEINVKQKDNMTSKPMRASEGQSKLTMIKA